MEYLSYECLAFTVQDIAEHQNSKPMFIVEGATRFDLYQGDIGNVTS